MAKLPKELRFRVSKEAHKETERLANDAGLSISEVARIIYDHNLSKIKRIGIIEFLNGGKNGQAD